MFVRRRSRTVTSGSTPVIQPCADRSARHQKAPTQLEAIAEPALIRSHRCGAAVTISNDASFALDLPA
ncbi:hypothetical protein [Leptolyngbya iicbica]|uniref:Uncharacterized protein n=2 Tax=Cyanophyceae TaxID=3028117 RepID=A0A4Q7E6K4_9CYAN|nr:hypothetical protein [Leptolyngbya sp. LK]RZM77843.1 hypothetical protein DYY88_14840 [Leptolyngbya sp. LK]